MIYKVQIDDLVRDATTEEAERIETVMRENALQMEQDLAALNAKESARAKLKALGLTENEINTVLGL